MVLPVRHYGNGNSSNSSVMTNKFRDTTNSNNNNNNHHGSISEMVIKNPLRFFVTLGLILALQGMAFVYSQFQCYSFLMHTRVNNNNNDNSGCVHQQEHDDASSPAVVLSRPTNEFVQVMEKELNCMGLQECLANMQAIQTQSETRLKVIHGIRDKLDCATGETLCLETKLNELLLLQKQEQTQNTNNNNNNEKDKDNVELSLKQISIKLGCHKGQNTMTCVKEQLDAIEKKNQLDKTIHDSFIKDATAKQVLSQQERKALISGTIHQVDESLLESKYRPKSEWSQSYPKYNIVGMAKAGTSQFYNILTHHQDTRHLHNGTKEFCVPYAPPLLPPQQQQQQIGTTMTVMKDYNDVRQNQDLQKALFEYHSHIHIWHNRGDTKKQTVNGCIQTNQLSWHYQYLPQSYLQNAKYFFLLRDPADLLWAAWNFWRQPDLDAVGVTALYQTNKTEDYRSPELFHEIVASNGKLVSFAWIHRGVLKQITEWARTVIQAVGRENVLFLRNEAMAPDQIQTSGFLQEISKFTGLSVDGFDKSTTKQRTNCNDEKGEYSKCSKSSLSSANKGLYSISNKRPMMEKTRQLIYLLIHDDCVLWKKEFGVEYKECLDVLPY